MVNDNKKVAFITGVTGQDGAYLAKFLLENGWEVHGGFRRGSSSKIWRLDYLGITNDINLIEFQLNEPQYMIEIFKNIQPAHIYNLAGESFVADSFNHPGVTIDANVHGSLNILEAARIVVPEAKLFFASSSEIFGRVKEQGIVNESTIFDPINPYAISKLTSQYIVRLYREHYKMFACSGILFNHEGPLRGKEYVTRKITINIARLKLEGGDPIALGNLDSGRDWGAANDYIKAMHAMLSIDDANDFIIATGKVTKVRDFLRITAKKAGFEPVFEGSGLEEICYDSKSGARIAIVSEKYYRKFDTPPILGDSSLIEKLTGWTATTSLEELVGDMLEADLIRWKVA
jgi:GDPmannose 4,6-dehydratase